jgi:hypothetical protein
MYSIYNYIYINYIERYISTVIVYIIVFYSVFFLFNNKSNHSSYEFTSLVEDKTSLPSTEMVPNSVAKFIVPDLGIKLTPA